MMLPVDDITQDSELNVGRVRNRHCHCPGRGWTYVHVTNA